MQPDETENALARLELIKARLISLVQSSFRSDASGENRIDDEDYRSILKCISEIEALLETAPIDPEQKELGRTALISAKEILLSARPVHGKSTE
ncbi:MAG: hypothetical protein MPW17_22800 (plasmid) [Candidatus Manganitrophus sp.]|nr:hypothetical protein [Candidatus Manganitrophus sp.]MDC4228287.1 hypothetical protein [Candidatus Manganitrophus sp.]WDT73461.1 MAG: hypothetical protein MPW17_22800 [Candidatus Manganitrophus sp.]